MRSVLTPIDRRGFLTALGTGALAGCRSATGRGPLVLRLSHSMAAGVTSLHTFADTFRTLAEATTGGAVTIRVFPSGTLGQEREVVQQLQEGLVDFMVSGIGHLGQRRTEAAGLGLPVHVARLGRTCTASSTGPSAARRPTTSIGAVRMRPLAWSDSFGFRHVDHAVARHHRDGPARRSQDPDHPDADLRQGGGVDGRQPDADGVRRGLHVAADRRDRRLRARREHDHAAALLRDRAASWRAPATSPACWACGRPPRRWRACPPTSGPRSKSAALEAARRHRARGPEEDAAATQQLVRSGMTIREIDHGALLPAAERLWETRGARARHHVVARGDPRVSAPVDSAAGASRADVALQWSIAVLVVAQAAVVGLQVVGRHVLHRPIPWTEEIARLLLAWLMCVGGVAALRHGAAPARDRARAPARRAAPPGGGSRACAWCCSPSSLA